MIANLNLMPLPAASVKKSTITRKRQNAYPFQTYSKIAVDNFENILAKMLESPESLNHRIDLKTSLAISPFTTMFSKVFCSKGIR